MSKNIFNKEFCKNKISEIFIKEFQKNKLYINKEFNKISVNFDEKLIDDESCSRFVNQYINKVLTSNQIDPKSLMELLLFNIGLNENKGIYFDERIINFLNSCNKEDKEKEILYDWLDKKQIRKEIYICLVKTVKKLLDEYLSDNFTEDKSFHFNKVLIDVCSLSNTLFHNTDVNVKFIQDYLLKELVKEKNFTSKNFELLENSMSEFWFYNHSQGVIYTELYIDYINFINNLENDNSLLENQKKVVYKFKNSQYIQYLINVEDIVNNDYMKKLFSAEKLKEVIVYDDNSMKINAAKLSIYDVNLFFVSGNNFVDKDLNPKIIGLINDNKIFDSIKTIKRNGNIEIKWKLKKEINENLKNECSNILKNFLTDKMINMTEYCSISENVVDTLKKECREFKLLMLLKIEQEKNHNLHSKRRNKI